MHAPRPDYDGGSIGRDNRQKGADITGLVLAIGVNANHELRTAVLDITKRREQRLPLAPVVRVPADGDIRVLEERADIAVRAAVVDHNDMPKLLATCQGDGMDRVLLVEYANRPPEGVRRGQPPLTHGTPPAVWMARLSPRDPRGSRYSRA